MSNKEMEVIRSYGWNITCKDGLYSFKLKDRNGLPMPEVLGNDTKDAFVRGNMQYSVDRWIAETVLFWSTNSEKIPGDMLTRRLTENAMYFKDRFLETGAELKRVNYYGSIMA